MHLCVLCVHIYLYLFIYILDTYTGGAFFAGGGFSTERAIGLHRSCCASDQHAPPQRRQGRSAPPSWRAANQRPPAHVDI